MDISPYHAAMKFIRQPFRPQVDPFFFFPGGGRREMISAIRRDLENGVCLIIVTGDEGAGKTMSCRMAVNKLPAHLISYYDSGPVASFAMMVQRAAHLVLPDVPEEQPPEAAGDLLAAVAAELDSRQAHMVIVLDRAEQIHLATLERIRKMLDQYNGERPRFQLLLTGTTKLKESLEQLTIVPFQPVTEKRYHLEKLSYDQVSDYLSHVLTKAGAEEMSGFSAAEIDIIYRGGGGNFAATNRIALELLEGKQPTISSTDASKDGVRGMIGAIGSRQWWTTKAPRAVRQRFHALAQIPPWLAYAAAALVLCGGGIILLLSWRPPAQLPGERSEPPQVAFTDPESSDDSGQRVQSSISSDIAPRREEPVTSDQFGAGEEEPLSAEEQTTINPGEEMVEALQGTDQNLPQPLPAPVIEQQTPPPDPVADTEPKADTSVVSEATPKISPPQEQPVSMASVPVEGNGANEAQTDETPATPVEGPPEPTDTTSADDEPTDPAAPSQEMPLPSDADQLLSDANAAVAQQQQDQLDAGSPPAAPPSADSASRSAVQPDEGEQEQSEALVGLPAEQLLAHTKIVVQPQEVIILADETPKRLIPQISASARTDESVPVGDQDIDNLYQSRVAAAGDWFSGSAQPYTIFVTEFDSVEAVKQTLAEDDYNQIVEQLYLVEHNGNTPLVSVYYGQFGDQQAALAAQEALPESLSSASQRVMTTTEAAAQAGLRP